jgi:uncharacterized lipoprotein YmbA
MKKLYTAALIVLCTVALLAGCARSPAVTFYRLTPVTQSETSVLVKPLPRVAIASVTLPELVDRPQLVVSEAGVRVTILETKRWAEPLKSALPRLLAENISRSVGTDRVAAYPQNAAKDAEYRLFVDIQRFETTGDAVTVDALWTIRGTKEAKPVNGRSRIVEPSASHEYDAIVAAYSRAVAILSKEIALSIHTAQTKE